MTPNSLYPSFGVIDIATLYGVHKQTIPTRAHDPLRGTNGYGGYLGWDGSTDVDAEDMWTDLVNDLKPFYLPSTTFNSVTLYNKSSPTAPAIPVTQIPLAIVGTSASTDDSKATQKMWTFRTGSFGILKLVALDVPVGNFNKIYPASWSGGDNAILGALSDTAKAWQGRDGSIVIAPIAITFKLNDKLRREYGMT